MIARLSNWEQLLNDYLATVRTKPLTPGEHDGALFAAGAVEAMTGVDLAARFRNSYATCKDGLEEVRKAGHANLAALLDDLLPRVPKSMAQRGDVIMLKDKNLGVCFGSVALAVNDEPREGLARVERDRWLRAWKVG